MGGGTRLACHRRIRKKLVIISASRRVDVPVHELHHLFRCGEWGGGKNCQEGGRGVGVYSVVNIVTVESSKGTYVRRSA